MEKTFEWVQENTVVEVEVTAIRIIEGEFFGDSDFYEENRELQNGFYFHQVSDACGNGDSIVISDKSLETLSTEDVQELICEEASNNFVHDKLEDIYYLEA